MAARHNSALARVVVAAIGLTIACGRGGAPAEAPAPGPATSSAATPKTATPTEAASDEAIRELLAPWKGDLDGMVEAPLRAHARDLQQDQLLSSIKADAARHRPTRPASSSKSTLNQPAMDRMRFASTSSSSPSAATASLPGAGRGRGDIAAADLHDHPATAARASTSPRRFSLRSASVVVTARATSRRLSSVRGPLGPRDPRAPVELVTTRA